MQDKESRQLSTATANFQGPVYCNFPGHLLTSELAFTDLNDSLYKCSNATLPCTLSGIDCKQEKIAASSYHLSHSGRRYFSESNVQGPL